MIFWKFFCLFWSETDYSFRIVAIFHLLNWIVATETIENIQGKNLFAETRYLIFFGQDLENSNHSGMLQPGLATTLIIIHLTH